MQIIIAVIGATFTYVITKFILENVLEQRKIIGDILGTVYHYLIIDLTLTSDERIKASQELAILSKKLIASTQLIPFYNLCEKAKIVKPISNINKASAGLYSLSKKFLEVNPIDFDELLQDWGKVAIALDFKI